MIKFNYKKGDNSKTFSFTRTSEKMCSKAYDDFSDIEGLFQPKKEKLSFFRSVYKRINNSKIGGLIYIAVFVLVLFIGYVAVRKLYYSESVMPEEFEVVELHEGRRRSKGGEIGRTYLKMVVEFEADGAPVSATLYYEGAHCDAIYKDWCSYYAFYDSDQEDTAVYLDCYEKVKDTIGTLYYNKKNPEKIVDSIIGY